MVEGETMHELKVFLANRAQAIIVQLLCMELWQSALGLYPPQLYSCIWRMGISDLSKQS